MGCFLKAASSPLVRRSCRLLPSIITICLFAAFDGFTARGQAINQVIEPVDPSLAVILRGHHPEWATEANDLGPLAVDETIGSLILVLSRTPKQEQAFKKFLADQQSQHSSDYHRWLTPEQVGERFGISEDDITSIRGWLQSQGLSVKWVSPSRTFIGFGGGAGDVGRAFHTQLHRYRGQAIERISPSSDPRSRLLSSLSSKRSAVSTPSKISPNILPDRYIWIRPH